MPAPNTNQPVVNLFLLFTQAAAAMQAQQDAGAAGEAHIKEVQGNEDGVCE